jgi:hypothetical protein
MRSSPCGGTQPLDFQGLTSSKNMVSMSSRDLPLVSGRKKKMTRTAAKLQAAKR